MSDRRNRFVLGFIGLLLLVGGGLSVCLGAGAFGSDRRHRHVFDSTVVRWWNEGGWMSYAVVVAIAVALVVIGLVMALGVLRRNDGRPPTRTVMFTADSTVRGKTTLRGAAISHTFESDLERLPDVHRAIVGLFGRYPDIELTAVLEIVDDTDLELLPVQVDAALGRLAATTGIRPDPVQITLRFKSATRERQLA